MVFETRTQSIGLEGTRITNITVKIRTMGEIETNKCYRGHLKSLLYVYLLFSFFPLIPHVLGPQILTIELDLY